MVKLSKAEKADNEQRVLELLRVGRLAEAATEHYRGISDHDLLTAEGVFEHIGKQLRYDAEMQKEIAAQITLSVWTGYGARGAGKRIVKATGGTFDCPMLVDWLATTPCGGFALRHRPEVPADVAELFAHTLVHFAVSEHHLKGFLAQRDILQGIRISRPHDECKVCALGPEFVAWGEISSLPRLPRHWGCRCVYSPWTKSWEDILGKG